MSGPANNPNKGSRWGSLLSGAVAGLESRLDSILADDDQASANARAAEEAARQEKLKQKQNALKTEQGMSRWRIYEFRAD
jgi:TATA element modulatory factor